MAVAQKVSTTYIRNAIADHDNIILVDAGVYATYEWDMSNYQRIELRLADYLMQHELPVRLDRIIEGLGDEYSAFRIKRTLDEYVRFKKIDPDYYDLTSRWKNRTCGELIKMIDEPVKSFVNYLVKYNNCSYKPVLGLIFLENMDDDGRVHMSVLEDEFYKFYSNRQKQGLIVESI